MQQRDDLCRAQPRQRRFELERLVDRFVHELLDDRLAPRREGVAPEPAAETLGAGDADAGELAGIAVEDDHPGVAQDLRDLSRLARFEIVVAEHRGGGDAERGQLLGQHRRFLGQPVIGEVAAEQCDVRGLADAREQRLKGPLG